MQHEECGLRVTDLVIHHRRMRSVYDRVPPQPNGAARAITLPSLDQIVTGTLSSSAGCLSVP
jgi:hypothetical protein